jgi:CBS domain-containing protein
MVSKIGDVMTRRVITLKRGSGLSEAVRIMADHSISCIIIVDNRMHPLGIVTERDMVRRVLRNKMNTDVLKIDDIMSSPVMTISSEKKITDAINMMQKYHFRRVVVTDKNERLLGILTQSDLLLEVHRVQLELEKMNENLRNTIRSLGRYSKIGTEDARIKSLKSKITRLEKSLERANRSIEKQLKQKKKKR